jgi:hypothetical protein
LYLPQDTKTEFAENLEYTENNRRLSREYNVTEDKTVPWNNLPAGILCVVVVVVVVLVGKQITVKNHSTGLVMVTGCSRTA